jgi:TRAP-type C4-dicarboxylate transport system substrate-binding protein
MTGIRLTGLSVACAAALGISVGTVGVGGNGAWAQPVTLKAASFLPRRIVFARYFYLWARQVNKTCRGQVRINVVGPAAIKSLEQWNAVKNGVVDMHYGPANYFAGAMPEGDVMALAEISPAEMRKNGALKMLQEQYAKKMNVHYLTHMHDGVNFYLYTTKPAKNGRFDGFRLRSVPIYDAFFKHLGAQTVRIGGPAVYTALERKTVDGLGWPLWAVAQFGWTKFVKYRYGPGFFSAAVIIIINQDRWKKLSDAQRTCLTSMAVWLEKQYPKWRAAENAKQQAAQDKAGVKYVDLGPGFKKKAHELYWAKMRKGDAAWVDKIKPLLTK